MAYIRAHIYVTGIVQGVFFRAHIRRNALKSEVTGWVKNLPDRRLEAVFEGNEEDVEAIVEWCRSGPPGAVVQKVELFYETPTKGFDGFEIAY